MGDWSQDIAHHFRSISSLKAHHSNHSLELLLKLRLDSARVHKHAPREDAEGSARKDVVELKQKEKHEGGVCIDSGILTIFN